MASSLLALPGVVFVGEDDRARLIAHLGPAAGWMIPKGVLGWSTEVSVVARGTLSEQVRRDAKIVLPEEQIPPAKLPLTHEAALKSPLVAVSSKLTQRLVDSGIRVHTVGADRVTSSFYYIAEGGSEPSVRVEGDLVAAVGAMLGDRADNAAIERVLDGLVDRLLRSLSKDRVTELSLELAAALPRAAADGTGTQDVDLDSFEKELSALVAKSEKYASYLEEIASKLSGSNERRVDIPLFGDARKVSQGPFELTVGEQKVALVTHERWLATGPFAEPKPAGAAAAATAAAQTSPAPVSQRAPAPVSQRSPAPLSQRSPAPAAVQKSPAPAPVQKSAASAPAVRKPVVPAVSVSPTPSPARPFVAPLSPPRPGSSPPPSAKEPAPPSSGSADRVSEQPKPKAETPEVEAPKLEAPSAVDAKVEATAAEAPKAEPSKAEPAVTDAKTEGASPAPVAAQPAEEAAPASEKAAAKSPESPEKPSVADDKKTETKPKKAKTPARGEPTPPAVDADSATKSPEKKGGVPWLWILVLLAAAFGGYRLWLSGR